MKRLILLATLAVSMFVSNGQDYAKLVSAFNDSYAKEKTGKYAEAAAALKALYDGLIFV